MERIQEPHSPDAEVQAERDRVRAELQAAQQTLEALEQQLAARTTELQRWQERAFKGPLPDAGSIVQAVLGGLLLGAGISTAIHFLAGWSFPLG